MLHAADRVELTHQLQQQGDGSSRLGGSSANPTCQPIGVRLVLLIGQLLRSRPVMDRDRLTVIVARNNTRPVMVVHHLSLSFPRETMP
jgi:hypothetical protein